MYEYKYIYIYSYLHNMYIYIYMYSYLHSMYIYICINRNIYIYMNSPGIKITLEKYVHII